MQKPIILARPLDAVRALASAMLPLAMVLAAMPAASAGHTAPDLLDCHGTSPLDNECHDDVAVRYEGHALYQWGTLGYVGRLNVTLQQPIPALGITVRETYSCDHLGLEGVLEPVCTGPHMSPTWWPALVPGLLVTLRCRTFPTPGVLPGVGPGPWGLWACAVDL